MHPVSKTLLMLQLWHQQLLVVDADTRLLFQPLLEFEKEVLQKVTFSTLADKERWTTNDGR